MRGRVVAAAGLPGYTCTDPSILWRAALYPRCLTSAQPFDPHSIHGSALPAFAPQLPHGRHASTTRTVARPPAHPNPMRRGQVHWPLPLGFQTLASLAPGGGSQCFVLARKRPWRYSRSGSPPSIPSRAPTRRRIAVLQSKGARHVN